MQDDVIKDLIKSQAQFTFELEGDSEIDAQTLSKLLDNTVNLINEIVQGEPEAYVNLKVTKFSTGSFDIDFQAVAEQVANILVCPESLATYLVGGVTTVFKIAQHIKGKKPNEVIKNEKDSEIINTDGESITVSNKVTEKYFNNSNIENCVINITNVVSETERPGFRIKDSSRNEQIRFNREDFSNIKPVVELMQREKKSDKILSNTTNQVLIIRKPDLMGGSKWGFVLDRNIDATIEDKEWLDSVRENHIRFCAGMRLPVNLKMDIYLDQEGMPIKGSEKYTIIKVIGELVEPIDAADTQLEM